MNFTTEAIFVGFLQSSAAPVMVSNWEHSYRKGETLPTHLIIFVEESYFIGMLQPEIRQIAVVSRRRFPKLLESFVRFDICNVVFVVYDRRSCLIHHYNSFLKKVESWEELKEDPLLAATQDLAGTPLSNSLDLYPDERFFNDILLNLNASRALGLDATITIWNTGFATTYDTRLFTQFYMNRMERYYVLVPTLNKQVPLVLILTDPFDLHSWMFIVMTIFAMAAFRNLLAKNFTLHPLLRNATDLVVCITTGSAIRHFHRDLERQLFGLFLLLYVVLTNAYLSLVITFLSTPRFYPELDTLQQLNETCCWQSQPALANFSLQHYGDCDKEVVDRRISEDPDYVRVYNESACFAFYSAVRGSMISLGHFRWSRQTLNEWPVVVLVSGDPVVAERLQLLCGLYFAEGALDKRFEVQDRSSPNHAVLKSYSVGDLALVWQTYVIGEAAGTALFVVEIFYSRLQRSCRIRNGK